LDRRATDTLKSAARNDTMHLITALLDLSVVPPGRYQTLSLPGETAAIEVDEILWVSVRYH